MDLFDLFSGADSFHIRKLLEHSRQLTDAQLDAPLDNSPNVFPWPEPARSLRDLLKRLVQTKEIWTAAMAGGTLPNLDAEPPELGTPDALLTRLETADREFTRILSDVRNRNAWSDTFVDALCEPPETFSFGGTFAHIITFNTYQRLVALEAWMVSGAAMTTTVSCSACGADAGAAAPAKPAIPRAGSIRRCPGPPIEYPLQKSSRSGMRLSRASSGPSDPSDQVGPLPPRFDCTWPTAARLG